MAKTRICDLTAEQRRELVALADGFAKNSVGQAAFRTSMFEMSMSRSDRALVEREPAPVADWLLAVVRTAGLEDEVRRADRSSAGMLGSGPAVILIAVATAQALGQPLRPTLIAAGQIAQGAWARKRAAA